MLALLMAGPALSTVTVALGPAARAGLSAVSVAVPAAREIPSEPLPVMVESVTVRVVPVPITATDAVAVAVVFSVMLFRPRRLVLKFASAYAPVQVSGAALAVG